MLFLVGGGGFEPPKSLTTDLQSAPFGHSGTLPDGASDRNRTSNLLITNQLLCLLSYTSVICIDGASGRTWTTDTGIFSPLLYQLSYRGLSVLNEAASLSLPHLFLATRRGLEPLTSSVTGWRTNQLYYRAILLCLWWAFTDSNRGPIGYEPTALTYWAKGPNCVEWELTKAICLMVGVKRLELPTPWSQTTCATNCATPRTLTTL